MAVFSGAATGAATGFAAGGPFGAIAGGLFGGITSLFSEASQAEQMNENIRQAQALMAKGLISSDQLQDRLHSIDRQFNSRLTNVLNTTAIRSRGIANQGTVKAAAAGALEGSRLATEVGIIEQSLSENRGIRQAQASLELQKTNPDMIGAFVEGGVAGATAGAELGRLTGGRELPALSPSEEGGQSSVAGFGTIPSMSEAGNFNPFLRDNQQRIGNLTDPFHKLPTQNPFIGNVQGGF
jgi:hypothetical protein